MNTIKTRVNGAVLAVDAQLKDWVITKPNTTMIAYIAVNAPEGKLFIQWPNGTGNFYSKVPTLNLTGIVTAPSAGKFFHQFIKDRFESEKITSPLISLAPKEEDDVLESDEFGDENDEEGDDIFFSKLLKIKKMKTLQKIFIYAMMVMALTFIGAALLHVITKGV